MSKCSKFLLFNTKTSSGLLASPGGKSCKVEAPIHDNIRELITWECKEHGVKS